MKFYKTVVTSLFEKVCQLQAVVLSIFYCLQSMSNLILQVGIDFGDMKGFEDADQLDGALADFIGLAFEKDRFDRTNIDQGSDLALHGQYSTGALRIVTFDRGGLFDISLVTFKDQLQRYRSLASGRDCPVETGDSAASTPAYLGYLQLGLSPVLHSEVVGDFASLIDLTEIKLRLG